MIGKTNKKFFPISEKENHFRKKMAFFSKALK